MRPTAIWGDMRKRWKGKQAGWELGVYYLLRMKENMCSVMVEGLKKGGGGQSLVMNQTSGV